MATRSNICGLAALIAGFVSSTAFAEDVCLQGYGFMGNNPDGAIARCTADLAKEQRPDAKSKILVYMASAYAAKKDFDRALTKYDEALKVDPNNASAYFYRASFFRYERKDLDRALSNYSAAIALDPSYPHFSARADVYAQMDRLEAATADYDAAIRAEPKSVTLLTPRGDLWRRRGDWGKALADYEAALAINPTYSNAMNARSAAHAMLGLGQALAGLQQTSQSGPRYQWASSRKVGSTTVDVWSLGGKPHHCAVASSYGEPASAIGRSAAGYALTLASGKWSLRPQNAYPVEVQAQGAAQPASAKAVDAITLGIPLKADKAFLAAWTRTYQLKVKAANSTVTVENSDNSVLSAIDECWRAVNAVTATNSAPSDDPFAAAR